MSWCRIPSLKQLMSAPLSLASSRVLWRRGFPISETLRKEGVLYNCAGSLCAKMEVGVQVGRSGLRSCATKELGGRGIIVVSVL